MTNTNNNPAQTRWFGFERVKVDYKNHAVDITVGSESSWDRSHLRRLRQSSDLPGHVPVIDADVSSEGRPYVVTAAMDEPTLSDKLASNPGLDWRDSAGIAQAVAQSCHEAHQRGLYHGSLSPDDIFVIDDEIAISGMGLTHGGVIPAERDQWVAPEVSAGERPSERSDVYSLGKLLEASLGDSIKDVPRSVKRLIMWSSSDTAEARPRSASEFAEILRDGLGESARVYRPAFIPTIRATELTADAEKAAAGAATPLETASGTSTKAAKSESVEDKDVKEETSEPQAAEENTAEESAKENAAEETETERVEDSSLESETTTDEDSLETVDSDATSEIEITDDLKPVTTTEDPDVIEPENLEDEDPTEELDTASMPKKAGAAAAGAAGIAAMAASKSKSKKEGSFTPETDSDSDNSEDKESAEKEKTLVSAAATGNGEKSPPQLRFGQGYQEEQQTWTRYIVPLLLVLAIPLILWALTRNPSGEANETSDSGKADSQAAAPSKSSDKEKESTTTTKREESKDTETSANKGASKDDTQANASPDGQTTQPAAESTTTTEKAKDEPTTTEKQEKKEPAQTTTTEAPETTTTTTAEQPDKSEAPGVVTGPIKASDAALQVTHGIPGTPVDVYVDGQLLVGDFKPETIAGPIDLPAGDHEIKLFAATSDPASTASERTDGPVISETITASGKPTALVAHLDEEASPTLSAFSEPVTDLAAGESRVVVRNLAAAPGKATVTIDGEEQTAPLGNGDELQLVLDPGKHTVVMTDDNGEEITTAELTIAEGELTTVSFVGSSEDATQSVVVQRYSGLASAPAGVPTGDSGLLGNQGSGGARTIMGLMLMMIVTAGLITIRRKQNRT